jgi:carbonic anhydrase
MSIYSSSTSWTCPTSNQSPINLSQSSAKPCDLLCELVMDDVMIPQANVMVSDEGMILQSTAGLGSCKFNGEGYTCTMILVNHPSHHTIENIQADAEVIAIFTNPTGKYVCVSSLVRVNSSQTSSTHFFNSFVGYASTTQQYTTVNLGENWSLGMMVPPNGAYFVYDGSMVVPPCQNVTWVVFKAMINIDPTDFALLVKNVTPGSRPIQALGDRQVLFNDISQLPGAMPHDNKTYMRCKRAAGGKKAAPKGGLMGGTKDVTKPDVKSKADENNKNTITHKVSSFVSKQVEANGILSFVDLLILVIALGLGFFYGKKIEYRPYGTYLMRKAQDIAGWLRNLVIRPSPVVI